MKKDSRIYVSGHTGLVGSAIKRKLKTQGYLNLICRSRKELDLADSTLAEKFFLSEKPDYVFCAAGKSGGIEANRSRPAEFIYDNSRIIINTLDAAYRAGVKKLIYTFCSCVYPKNAPQPIAEKSLLTGPFEETNEAFSAAQLLGVKMCQAYNRQYGASFIPAVSDSVFGPGDDFESGDSHVLAALIRKFSSAVREKKESVSVWGTGKPKRGFIYSDDLADALVFLMNFDSHCSPLIPRPYGTPLFAKRGIKKKGKQGGGLENEIINISSGESVSIMELASKIAGLIGFHGRIEYDISKPDGMPLKMLSPDKLFRMGWKPAFTIESGLKALLDENR